MSCDIPRCGLCFHSIALPAKTPAGWGLFCMVACGDEMDRASAERVQHGRRGCEHFERAPGAEGDDK